MIGRRLRRYFLTGLVVIAPVGLTAGVLYWAFGFLDGILGEPMREALNFRIPGLGFVLLGVGVVLIGWIVQQAAGRQLLHLWNEALSRFPLTGRIYDAASQIIQTVVGERKRIFRQAILVPYPTNGLWAVAFVTNDSTALFGNEVGEPCVNVFVPTTPNPTSGFMLVVPVSQMKVLNMPVEDAMKLVISAGAVGPRASSPTRAGRGLDLDHLLRDTSEFRVD